MGTIRVTPVQNKISTSISYGKWYMMAKMDQPLTVEELGSHILMDSKIERAQVSEIVRAILRQISELLCNGHAIRIPHLGILKVGVTSTGADTVSEYNANTNIKGVHIVLLPDKEIKDELAKLHYEKFYYKDAHAEMLALDAAEAEEGNG
jgi:nucleoid DNA-binding protein